MTYNPRNLASLIQNEGPFLSLYLNTEAKREEAPKEIELRWKDARRDIAERGASKELLEKIDGLVDGSHRRGDGLVVIASKEQVIVTENLSKPIPDSASWGELPHLLPWLEWVQDNRSFGVALVDRTGADIYVQSLVRPDWSEHVDGDDFPIKRVKAGGWSQRRFQQRAENLWEKNAKEVAEALTRIVSQEQLEVVVISGDVRAVGFLREHLPEGLPAAIQEMNIEAHSVEEISEELDKTVAAYVAQQTDALLEKFREERGQQDLAVDGVDDTCAALREAKVATLFVPRDRKDGTAYFVRGSSPLQVSPHKGTLADLNLGPVASAPISDVLVASALSAGSAVHVIPQLPADMAPHEAVGALLRFDYVDPGDESSDDNDEVDDAAEGTFPASDPPAW